MSDVAGTTSDADPPADPADDDAEIFAVAVEIADPEERSCYLDAACGADAARRGAIGELVAIHLRGGAAEASGPLVADIAAGLDALGEEDAGALDDDAPDPFLGAVVAGVTLVRRIGSGGFGIVYEGRQERPTRLVAVKVLRPELASRDLVRRFELEADLLAQLDHPGIARIHAVAALPWLGRQVPCLVMELVVDGQPLTAHAAVAGLPIRQRLELFSRVAAAVAEAHRRGVIHRDLKPANILIGADGRPRVIDFGWGRANRMAAPAHSLRTHSGQIIGTFRYMSPEHFDGDPRTLDTRSDVYSLGVVLHELLAGSPPYDVRGRNPFEAAAIVRDATPPLLHRLDVGIPRDAATIAATCLRKDPRERYSSAHELAADLDRHLAGEAILASPPSAIDALRRFARRHTAAAAALGASVAALVIAVAAISVFALQSERARRAEASAREAEGRAMALAEARLGESRRETARARRQLHVANLYKLAGLVEGPNTSAAATTFHDLAAALGLDTATHRGSSIPGLPIEMACLWQGIEQSVAELGGMQPARLTGVVWSPDGRHVAAVAEAGPAILVDLHDPLTAIPVGDEGGVVAAAFNPDGTVLATLSRDSLALLDVASRRVLRRTAVGQSAPVALALRPDGLQITTASADGGATLWDARTLRVEAKLSTHSKRTNALEYSADGSRLVTASEDGLVCFWDTTMGTRLHRLEGHRSGVTATAISPDGTLVASGDRHGLIRVWSMAEGSTVAAPRQRDGGVACLAWSPDGSRLASGATTTAATIWDPTTGKEFARLDGHERRVSDLVWTPDARRLVTASLDRRLRLWDAASGRCLRTLEGHPGAVAAIAVSPDGTMLASASHDRTARLWDIAGDHPATVLAAGAPIVAATISADGSRIAAGTADGELLLFDAATLRRSLALPAHTGAVTALAMTADGRRVVTGGSDGRLRLVDADTGSELLACAAADGPVRQLAVAAGGCVVAGKGALVRWIDFDGSAPLPLESGVRGGRPVVAVAAVLGDRPRVAVASDTAVTLHAAGSAEVLASYGDGLGKVHCIAASADGRLLAVGSMVKADGDATLGLVHLFDTASGRAVARREAHAGRVIALRFSADGSRLFTTGPDDRVLVLDTATGETLHTLTGLDDSALAVASSPSGDRLATGGADTTLRLWDISDGEQLAVLRGHAGRVTGVAFAPGGDWLVTTGDDGTARVWGRCEAEVFRARGANATTSVLQTGSAGR